jgi:cytochrome P450
MNQYTRDLQNVASQAGIRIAFPGLVKLASYLPLPLFSETYASLLRMRSYAEESIRRYESPVAEKPNRHKPTLFAKLFQATEDTMSHEEIVSSAQSYIVAGSDTTAHSLTYLTWAVCRDEKIKAKLVGELQNLPDGYQDEDLKALPYLNQVIQETLRLYSAAPAFLPREVPAGGCEIDGHWMPGGTAVQTQAYSMHRNAEIFPKPEQ